MKRIGILGSGIVGQTLADGFIKHGHKVMIGTRNEDKLWDWSASHGGNCKLGSFKETADFGEILVLATKGSAAKEVLKQVESHNLSYKTIIDATNPIADAAPVNGVLKFFTNLEDSLMERLQKEYPDAHFVKAFNSIGSAFMVNPEFEDGKPSMFICGDDESAKKEVGEILDRFGFDVADMGNSTAARAIEPLCILWCIPGLKSNSWNHAFKLLKK